MNRVRRRSAVRLGLAGLAGGDIGPAISVGLAALVSALVIWWPTGSTLLAAGFAATGILVAAILFAVRGAGAEELEHVQRGSDSALLRDIADASTDAIAVTDGSGRLVCANATFTDWFGGVITPPNLGGGPTAERALEQAGKRAWATGEAPLAGLTSAGLPCNGVVRRAGRAADHLVWQFFRGRTDSQPFNDFKQLASGMVGRAFGDSGIMAAVTSSSGLILEANAAFAVRATGRLDADTMAGIDFAGLLRVDKIGLIRFASESRREGSTPLRLVEITPDRTAADAPILMLLVDEDGGAAERGIALDYVESLLAGLPYGLAIVDREGRFLFANPAFGKAAGLPGGSSPVYPSDLVVAEDMTALSEAIRRHVAARTTASDITVSFKRRPDQPVTLGIMPVRGLGDAAVVLSVKDEQETDDLKRQVIQAQKMQAVGHLAGGIAHDFNNILTAVLGSCDLMLLRNTPGDSDYDDIQLIRSNANRAANLTRQLLAFSRQQTLRPRVLNLSDIVADVSHLLKRLIGENVTLDVRHGRGLDPVRADPVQLEQVIVNLAVNARDAMPRGGQLTIETRPALAADLEVGGADIVPPGAYSLISVNDTGSGIAPEILPKIFDPFFSTKDVGKGTGLGLATVYGIIKQSGGFIFATSRLGQGTTFTVLLPAYAGAQVDAAVPPESANGGGTIRALRWGSGTILLVEDEEVVRAVAERALVRAGYTVITASQGEEGLERFIAGAEIDLVISDVMMPQMDGPTMVKAIRRARADVPVLFMSGYAEQQLRQTIALANVGFLPKPFSVAQLVDAVATIREASAE